MFIRRFGFVAGAALVALGLVLAAIGWGLATIWSPPTSLAVKAPQQSVRALHIPPSIAGAGGAPPTISVTPPSGGRVGIAKVRADQATAWLDGLAHAKLTDFSGDSTTFTVDAQQGDAAFDPALLLDADITSESWLGDRDKPLTHDVVLDGRWSYVVVVKDSDKGPADVTLTWAVGMESAASTPLIIAGSVLAVAGAVVLVLAFRMRAANNEVPEEVSPWNPGARAAPAASPSDDGSQPAAPWQGLKDKALAMASSIPVIGSKLRSTASDDDYSFFDAKKNDVGTSAPATAPATNSIPTAPPLTGATAIETPVPGRPPAEPYKAPPPAAAPVQTSQYGPATGVTPTYQPPTGAHAATPPVTGTPAAAQGPSTQSPAAPTPSAATPGSHDDGAPMPWATPASTTPPPSAVPMTPQQAAAHFPPTSALKAQPQASTQPQQPADHASVQHHIDSATTAAQEAVSALPESPRRKAKRERELREQAQREGKTP